MPGSLGFQPYADRAAMIGSAYRGDDGADGWKQSSGGSTGRQCFRSWPGSAMQIRVPLDCMLLVSRKATAALAATYRPNPRSGRGSRKPSKLLIRGRLLGDILAHSDWPGCCRARHTRSQAFLEACPVNLFPLAGVTVTASSFCRNRRQLRVCPA